MHLLQRYALQQIKQTQITPRQINSLGQGVLFPGGAPPLSPNSLHQLASGDAPVVVGRATANHIADGQRQVHDQLHLIGAMGAHPGHQHNPANPSGHVPAAAAHKKGRKFQEDDEDEDDQAFTGEDDDE